MGDEDDEISDTWIAFFHRQAVHAWMCEVDASFIGERVGAALPGRLAQRLRAPDLPSLPSLSEDAFNLYGLKEEFPSSYRDCIETILGPAPGASPPAYYLPSPSLPPAVNRGSIPSPPPPLRASRAYARAAACIYRPSPRRHSSPRSTRRA